MNFKRISRAETCGVLLVNLTTNVSCKLFFAILSVVSSVRSSTIVIIIIILLLLLLLLVVIAAAVAVVAAAATAAAVVVAVACSRLSVSEDDRKSERAKNAISGSEKERAGEPVSIVLKTSFRPLEKRNLFLCQNVKCQNLRIELLARISRGHADLTVCCVLLRSFMSAVSQGISLSVEVSI